MSRVQSRRHASDADRRWSEGCGVVVHSTLYSLHAGWAGEGSAGCGEGSEIGQLPLCLNVEVCEFTSHPGRGRLSAFSRRLQYSNATVGSHALS